MSEKNGHIHQTMQKVEGNVTSYRGVHSIPAATAGQGSFARPDESAGGAA